MIVYVLVYAPLNLLSFLEDNKFSHEYLKSYKLSIFIGRNATKVPFDVYFFA